MTPTVSSAGRPGGKVVLDAPTAGTPRRRPASCPRRRRRRAGSRVRGRSSPGVMRSTIELGNATFARIQRASSGSASSARPATAFSVTWPLPGMLSQDITVKGARPAARRRFRPATIRPNAVFGRVRDCAASATMSGCAASKCLRRRRDVIAAFGDGQRDDADLRARASRVSVVADVARVRRNRSSRR